ncbi:MAG: murein biosynthesis integral membrane protein MurJ [Phenylobacterium sp.]|uniref:murein biosynthesis integral membrane protein MurJ n=1 Tax=Phenylobacterium sp. TaxID=1871053 RepID=UPI001A1B4A64|nr:murein biosynthesis integral membrane protein MurJ [Phenylobacterium sp.]MBJ7411732.1 murein biosynthesis integral membrane protein MurJ [Phenylobacterium sp.]
MTETPADAQPPAKKGGLLRSSAIFSGLTLVSRFLGLARDLAITARLGASQTIAADAYYTALAFPNLFRRMFAEGAFAAAFVPDYAKRLVAEGKEAADRFAADALATMAAVTIAITIACQLAMPWIMTVYSYGFLEDPAKFKLAVILTQITMPYLPCMVIAALFAGTLQARGRFIIYGFYPTLLNVVMLAAVLPQKDPTTAAYAASWGVLVAGVSQAALCWWGAHRSGARIHPRHLRLTGQVKTMLRRMVPGVIASSATQINLFISAMLASQVAGMRVWLNVAERFYQLPLSLVGVAIGVALLPRLSTALQVEDKDDAQGAMDQAVVFGLALSLPAAAALMGMPYYLTDGFFTRGAFTSQDAADSARLLFHYGWGVPAFVLIKILQPAFFARGDTRNPMNYSLISVAVNIALGVALFFTMGFQGIAFATAAASWITVFQMVAYLRAKSIWTPSKRAVGKVVRVTLASVGMGVAVALASHFRPVLEAPLASLLPHGTKEIAVLLVCLAGAALYPVLLFAFGGVTPGEARAAFRRRKGDVAAPPADLP